MLYREPDVIPLLPGVFALVNRKRRFAYISFTINLQKRSHSISHMLLSQDEDAKAYWPIKDLPKHPSDEFVFMVMKTKDITEDNAMAAVASVQRQFANKNYRIIEGQRAASPMITLDGKKMTLAEAVREHSKVKYLTAYRRIERGWTAEQALGIEPPAPRWHQGKQAERREREAARA
jgi:hypothetical protein